MARLRALTHQRLRHEPLYLSAPSERKRPEPGLAARASPVQNSALSGDHQHLDSGLARYALPARAEEPAEAFWTSLRLLEIAPFTVTVPLWAVAYRAPLVTALPADLSLWLEGTTGSLKSTLAALSLCHFGDFDRLHLPGSWVSTANALEHRAFVLKDTLFVIDDYAPRAGFDDRDLQGKAARLLRAQGNNSARGRLRQDTSERPDRPPRGFILSTGEQHPPGQSVLARTMIVELERGEIHFPGLDRAQAEAHRLPHAMAGYIEWLGRRCPICPTGFESDFSRCGATRVSRVLICESPKRSRISGSVSRWR